MWIHRYAGIILYCSGTKESFFKVAQCHVMQQKDLDLGGRCWWNKDVKGCIAFILWCVTPTCDTAAMKVNTILGCFNTWMQVFYRYTVFRCTVFWYKTGIYLVRPPPGILTNISTFRRGWPVFWGSWRPYFYEERLKELGSLILERTWLRSDIR